MLPIEEQLSLLVHLSKVDKHVAKEESELIHAIGKRNGLTSDQIENIIDFPKQIGDLKGVPAENKFEYLYNVIQLMKVDKKVYQKEIEFCEKVAMNLGYRPGVVAELSAYIYSDPSISTKRDYLKSLADQYIA